LNISRATKDDFNSKGVVDDLWREEDGVARKGGAEVALL
jgi:hypothetical protein